MRHLLVLLLLLRATFVTAVHATVLVPAEFREVVQGSTLIAYGRVIDVRPEWVDDRARVDTVVTLEVATWLKGGSNQTVAFKVPGGEMGRYRSVTIGAPVFTLGDEAVVFLKSDGSSMPIVFGLNQGVFRVRREAATGRRVVVPSALMARGDAPETLRRGAATRQPIPLESFGAQVRTVMAQSSGVRR
jgi:hypothetical protein